MEEFNEGDFTLDGNEGDDEGNIQIGKQELRTLYAKIADLEARDQAREEETRSLKEATRTNKGNDQKIDLEKLSRAQFAELILNESQRRMSQNVAQPLTELVLTMAIKEEIKEVASTHDDFFLYKEDVRKYALEHPQGTIEEAYIICKQKDPGRKEKALEAKKVEEEKKMKKEEAKRIPSGEKGGMPQSSFQPNSKMSLRDAAAKAMQDVFKE